MKQIKGITFVMLMSCAFDLHSQQKAIPFFSEVTPEGGPEWLSEIEQNPVGVNYFEIKKKYIKWMATDNRARAKTLDKKPVVNYYTRWERAIRPYVTADGTIQIPLLKEAQQKADEINNLQNQQSKLTNVPQWKNIGPNTTLHYEEWGGTKNTIDWQANVHRIAVAKTNDNILFCGSETGAVFKTTDGGRNWFAPNPTYFFGRYIYAIHIDPTDSETIYVGSEMFLHKSTDGGKMWQRLEGIEGRINSIRTNPLNGYVTVCTHQGFFRSVDGGNNFTKLLSGVCHDHELKPNAPNTVYLLVRDHEHGMFKFRTSTDNGTTFSSPIELMENTAAGRLAVTNAPGGEEYVYALISKNIFWSEGVYGGKGKPMIMRSTDGGKSWQNRTSRKNGTNGELNTKVNTFSDYSDEDYGGQGYFDMMVGVSDLDKDKVVFGLCNAYRSFEGGAGVDWSKGWSGGYIGGYGSDNIMHPDIQDCAISGDKIWICTDGGVRYSDDFFATKGEFRFNGIYASDFWGFDHAWNEDIMIGGRYHNGNMAMKNTYDEKSLYLGGVEMPTGYILKSDPHRVVFSDIGAKTLPGQLDENLKSGNSFARYPNEGEPFKGNMAFDPRYAQRILINPSPFHNWVYVGGNNCIFESINEGVSFNRIYDGNNEMPFIAFSRSNPDVIYAANNHQGLLIKSVDNGKNWSKAASTILPTWFPQNDWIEVYHIAVDPRDENTVWISTSHKNGVAKTTDGGSTWSNPLEGNEALQKENIRWIILTGDEYDGVYITTDEIGKIWYKDNTLSDWIPYHNGLPYGVKLVRVLPFYKEGKLRAATSQGVWEVPLYRPHFRPTAQPMITNLGSPQLSDPDMKVYFESYSILNQEGATFKWDFSPRPAYISDAYVRNPYVIFSNKAEYDVTLTVTDKEGKSHSRTIPKMVINPRQGSFDGSTSIESPEIGLGGGAEKVTLSASVIKQGEPLLFTFKNLDEQKTLTLYNTRGLILKQVKIQEAQFSLDTNELEKGIKLFTITTSDYIRNGKVIVE